jgi:putative phage-type endonuclease
VTALAVRQGSAEWLDARRTGIGSSDIPVIAGESPYRSAYSLWAEKTGLTPPETPDDDQAALFELGHLMEPVLLTLYERRTGRHPKRAPLMKTHPDLPWAHASLDATAPVKRIVEAKYTNATRWGSDGIPDDVLLQVQWQLFVVGWEVADVVALASRIPRVVEVPRDESLIDLVVGLASDFWRLVETRTPPPVDGSDATRRAIAAAHPQQLLPALSPTPDLVSLVDGYVEAKAQAKAAAEREATAGNALRAVIGDADGIDGYVTYRKSADSTRTNWPAVAKAYRELLEGVMPAEEIEHLDTLVSVHSATSDGPRVLRLSR